MLHHFNRLALFTLWGWSAAALGQGLSQARSAAQLFNVTQATRTSEGALLLTWNRPCGFEFYGVVARLEGEKVLKVAVAGKPHSFLCMGLPAPTVTKIDDLDLSRIETIAPMSMTGSMRAELSDVSEVKITGRDRRIDAVYESRCGSEVGMVFRRSDRNRLEVGVLEVAPRQKFAAAGGASCSYLQVPVSLGHLTKKAVKQGVTALAPMPKNINRAVILSIAPSQIQSSTNTGISLIYRRACNEAPVGLAVTELDGSNTVHVGVIVARYPNVRCSAQSKPAGWDVMTRSVTIDPKATIQPLDPQTYAAHTLNLRTPARFQKAPQVGLMLNTLGSCTRPVASVFAHDSAGHLAVGVLTLSTPSRCNSAMKEVSLVAPVQLSRDAVSKGQDKVFPLRLAGISRS